MFVGGDVEKGQLALTWQGIDDQRTEAREASSVEGKGKGKADNTTAAHQTRRATPVKLLEPAEGPEGMEAMVDTTLGLLFDAIKRI